MLFAFIKRLSEEKKKREEAMSRLDMPVYVQISEHGWIDPIVICGTVLLPVFDSLEDVPSDSRVVKARLVIENVFESRIKL